MLIKTFKQSEQFLAFHIPKTSVTTFPGELGLARAKYFLHLLGDPQEKIKVIHVAGTSGKGSTCYLINRLLVSQGFKIGLHQSPHLTDVRERYQINGQIISENEFINYLNRILPIIKMVGMTFHGQLTYFEILIGLAFLIFSEKKVDYAIMETGLGGRYDGTNVVMRKDKLSVLTKIGLDHTNILGKTIEKIALQKAMIINKNSQAISISQDPEAEKIIKKVTKNKEAKIYFVGFSSSPRRRGSRNMDSRLRGNDSIESLTKNLNLIGDYQMENASLALAAVNYLSQRDKFIIDKKTINKVFETADFPGRFDIKKINDKIVIFDGAHNPQKMDAFIGSLIKKYPNERFNFLVAFKKGKDYRDMLPMIIPWAKTIVLTSFYTEDQDMINVSEEPDKIESDIIRYNRIKLETKTIPNLKKAWKFILTKREPIVVTGSLYLVGEIFKLIKNNKALKLT